VTAHVGPLSQDVARTLLALAAEHGISSDLIKSTADGFVVPDALGDAYAVFLAPPTPEPKATPVKAAKTPARKTEKE
jgi:hypothetical protein